MCFDLSSLALTTPSVTTSLSAGTDSWPAAISTSTRRASAAAMRICLPPIWMPVEPDAPPWFTEEAVAHVHLAEESGYRAIGVDGDIGRQLIRRQRRLCALREGSLDRQQGVERHRGAYGNHQRATTKEDRTAGESGGLFKFCHGSL